LRAKEMRENGGDVGKPAANVVAEVMQVKDDLDAFRPGPPHQFEAVLCQYTEADGLTIDNNASERRVRDQAIRKSIRKSATHLNRGVWIDQLDNSSD
jgi:hypothetical protein